MPAAREVYRRLLPLSRFDMTPKLVQYFKGAQDALGFVGGPVRAPRLELEADDRAIHDAAVAALLNDTELEVLVGGDDWALEGFCAGATGWVTGVADCAPAECVELYDACRAGELERARAVYARLLPLARLDMTPKLVQFFKGAQDALGFVGGPVRPPRLALDADDRAVLDAAVAALRAPVAA